ncbi:diaminohydroxyphosphoribosylaminopyrimidine deaminase [Klebsiella pneumoniae]|uniref:Diaminohydroxyphosphoribosylaminopyrimidine deaminase n=1 Tax=Klebsiella pneumoniae TaxID=573 RepID=A0A2X3E4V3_KLEPN|nr:diaminohydroxyphosphoribosylaminopyrimidine deaminase [Klebsiella pneumoniae]
MQDEMYMARALKLAARGRFTTHPNPNVGCVIVKDGEIVGEGFTIAPASRMLKCTPCAWLAKRRAAPPPTSLLSPAATMAVRRHAAMR